MQLVRLVLWLPTEQQFTARALPASPAPEAGRPHLVSPIAQNALLENLQEHLVFLHVLLAREVGLQETRTRQRA